MLERIGIIGDIHAESTLLKFTLEYLTKLDLNAIICAGDIVDGAESVDICCQLIQEHNVIIVSGNHDRWFLGSEARELPEATSPKDVSPSTTKFIRELPKTRELQTSMGSLLLCHGLGTNDMGRLTPDDYGYAIEANMDLQTLIRSQRYRFVVNGHTHRSMVRAFTGLTVINAGTLKHDHNPRFAVADFTQEYVQFHSFDAGNSICHAEKYRL